MGDSSTQSRRDGDSSVRVLAAAVIADVSRVSPAYAECRSLLILVSADPHLDVAASAPRQHRRVGAGLVLIQANFELTGATRPSPTPGRTGKSAGPLACTATLTDRRIPEYGLAWRNKVLRTAGRTAALTARCGTWPRLMRFVSVGDDKNWLGAMNDYRENVGATESGVWVAQRY